MRLPPLYLPFQQGIRPPNWFWVDWSDELARSKPPFDGQRALLERGPETELWDTRLTLGVRRRSAMLTEVLVSPKTIGPMI